MQDSEFYASNGTRLVNGGADKIIRQIRLVGAGMVLLIIVGSIVLSVVLRSSETWAPLLDFPEQTVIEVTVDFVEIVGTKCYTEQVTVAGSFEWESVDPRGTVFPLGDGQATRLPADFDDDGCITQVFINPVPDGVKARDDIKLWVISGVEVPVADEHGPREGLPLVWTSQPFAYPPEPS